MEDISVIAWSRYVQEQTPPLISIVIPIYNLAAYLPRCLDSITQQKLEDIEIVAVDGGSRDGSVDILRERSQKDPRLTVVSAGRIGPGLARNEGARHATGEYLWFVDGDDLISPDCLTTIADQLEVTRPDVLFVDHEVRWPDGRVEPGPGHAQLARDTEACFTLAEQPWVTELTMASWNKVIRREFFLSRAVGFLPQWPHEDVPICCLLLMDAKRLSILNQVCYAYTKDRDGSAMTEAGTKHFAILKSYEIVLDEVKRRLDEGDPAVTPAVRAAFFDRAIWHYTTVFDAWPPGHAFPASRRLHRATGSPRVFRQNACALYPVRPAWVPVSERNSRDQVPADQNRSVPGLRVPEPGQQTSRSGQRCGASRRAVPARWA